MLKPEIVRVCSCWVTEGHLPPAAVQSSDTTPFNRKCKAVN